MLLYSLLDIMSVIFLEIFNYGEQTSLVRRWKLALASFLGYEKKFAL